MNLKLILNSLLHNHFVYKDTHFIIHYSSTAILNYIKYKENYIFFNTF